MEFLESLILVSEKAANIARAVREEKHLLSLLVQEKSDGEKNPRFAHDFKTLADVLVQEVVKHDLIQKFPELSGHIHGEESNEFKLQDGETVYLHVGISKDDTKDVLNKVLCDDVAADMLAAIVHSPVSFSDLPNNVSIPSSIPNIPLESISVWIDPIDSTAEYINAENKILDNVFTAGLPCVTVLIGAFLRDSGVPVVGVINQPFNCDLDNKKKPEGYIVWGICHDDIRISSINPPLTSSKVVVISASENKFIRERLINSNLSLLEAAGAGYKLLCVIKGVAGAYVLSKGTTFFWDTCGCDAVLRSLGGGILDYSKAVEGIATEETLIKYSSGDNMCNLGGIIAYVDKNICDTIVEALKS